MTREQDASEQAFQFSLTISPSEAHSHEKEALEFTDSLKSLGWELRPEKAGGPGQSPGSSGLAGV